MLDNLKIYIKHFIFVFVIFYLLQQLPSDYFRYSLCSEKERRKPPKAKRTQTMSKKVGAEFIKAQEALGEDLPDRAFDILSNLLRRDTKDLEQAQIID